MKSITVLLLLAFLSGCTRWIAPPYTNVEKIAAVKTGMSLQQVNEALGVEPYDIYFKGVNEWIVIYNYRVKDRKMKINGDYNAAIHSDLSQNNGIDWYGEKYFCYVYFKEKKVKSLITDSGKQKSEDILIRNNNIYLIQKNNLGYYVENDSIIFMPVR